MVADDDRLRRFEALIHASPDFIAIAAVDGRVEFVNAAGRALVGLGPDVDVTQTSISDFLTPEGLSASLEVEQPAVVRDGFWSGESTLRDWRDDSGIPVLITSFLVQDLRTGVPIAMATVQRDMRAIRAAEAAADEAKSALLHTEERQRALLTHMSDLLLVVDGELRLTYASPSASRILGHAEGSRLGRPALELVHPDDREAAAEALWRLVREPGPSPVLRMRVLRADGSAVLYEGQGNNLLQEPNVRGIIITARDVSASVRSERSQADVADILEIIASEASVREALDAIVTWVERELPGVRCTVLLVEGAVLRDGASPGMPDAYRQAIDGLPVDIDFSPCAIAVAAGRPVLVADLPADERWAPFHDLADACEVRSCWSFPIVSPASEAILGSFALYGDEPGGPDGRVEAVVARAIHLVGITVDRHRLLDTLAHQAHHDPLTALPNRAMLLARLTEILPSSTGQQTVVLFCDLDQVKVINDSLGHEVGDELLVVIGERLRAAFDPQDLVARFGGDEFVVLAGVQDATAATALAERVLEVVAQPVDLGARQIRPSVSVGVVVARPGQTASDVLRDADAAMYGAKRRGGNCYTVFDQRLRQRAMNRLDLEDQIRQGLDGGQFRLVYQPLVRLSDASVVGVEALLRWQHPERGLLAPDAFIQLAEETGLIVPLGAWVLETAVAAARRWQEVVDTERFVMSVNVAAQQLGSGGLRDVVADAVRSLGPWQLGLELTESAVMDNANALAAIEELATAGARLSIDDFGTGFSSLSYLTRLPVHGLKIDRAFVSNLAGTSSASTVAAAIINLAGNLDLVALAEGIETAAQRQRLLELGCQYGQGYLFSKGVPEQEALALLSRSTMLG